MYQPKMISGSRGGQEKVWKVSSYFRAGLWAQLSCVPRLLQRLWEGFEFLYYLYRECKIELDFWAEVWSSQNLCCD